MNRKAGISPEARRYARWLRKKMTELGITQAELTEKAGISEAAISYIVCESREPKISTVMKIADGMGLKMAFVPKKGAADDRQG